MATKAPDTRNKLDSNKGLNRRTKNSKPKKKASLRELRQANINTNLKLNPEKKISKGELFKKANGYSKTQKRLITKHELVGSKEDVLNHLKKITKTRKKAETKVRQEKHKAAVLYRRTNVKSKGSKGSTQANKKK